MDVTTQQHQWPKLSTNGVKGRSPPLELEVTLRSELYLLVFPKISIYVQNKQKALNFNLLAITSHVCVFVAIGLV